MYAIAEAHGAAHNTNSRDQSREWWTGKRWSPASGEAKVFETRKAAEEHAEAEVNRDHVIVDLDD